MRIAFLQSENHELCFHDDKESDSIFDYIIIFLKMILRYIVITKQERNTAMHKMLIILIRTTMPGVLITTLVSDPIPFIALLFTNA